MAKSAGRQVIGAMLVTLATAVLLPASAQARGWGEDFFKTADTNNDGALTKEEMAASRLQRLGGSDTDKDGFISADELAEHAAAQARARKDKDFSRFAGRFDANKDGKVALEEIKTFDPPFFNKADTNGDGKLTKEERQAAKAMRHKGRKGGMSDAPAGDLEGE